jgi:methylated-DNA-[protein]-cysteine S-methyltransferase
MQQVFLRFQCPIGFVHLSTLGEQIKSCQIADEILEEPIDFEETPVLQEAKRQLLKYFEGDLKAFDLPLLLVGTDFQKQVWQYLPTIPFGITTTYGHIANELGNPQAVRAVGAANGQNPFWIILPCHRVIGSQGKLTGYAGGLWRKKWLLQHELKYATPTHTLF